MGSRRQQDGGTQGESAKTFKPSSGSGETNTASNVGTGGVGVFKQKTGVDFEFKKINAGSAKITVTDDVANNEVDVDFGSVSVNNLSDVSGLSAITGETGSGNIVRTDSPTIVTPNIAGSGFANATHTHTSGPTGGTLQPAAILCVADAVLLGNDNGVAQVSQELTANEVRALLGLKVIRRSWQITPPLLGDVLKLYTAGYDGIGAKAPFAKIIRVGWNLESTAGATCDFNIYIRSASNILSGGVALWAADEVAAVSTGYEEMHDGSTPAFANDQVDSTADGSADECVVLEVTAIGATAPEHFDGFVDIELQA